MPRFSLRTLWLILAAIIIAHTSATAQQALLIKLSKDDQKLYDTAFDKVVAHFEKFEIYLKDNKTKEAIEELEAIVAVDFPAGSEGMDGVLLQIEGHIYLGEMYIEQSDGSKNDKAKNDLLNKAVAVLKAGIKKAPDVDERTYDLYMALGHAYKALGKKEDALSAFEQAEKIMKKIEDKQKKGKNG